MTVLSVVTARSPGTEQETAGLEGFSPPSGVTWGELLSRTLTLFSHL